mmetsp:Transcript_6879/g.12003  ORF Transcript_6879/g.12003 Transcript_6879/m.12003 type:complete len:242 (-) Transcript_6879:94-819(-)
MSVIMGTPGSLRWRAAFMRDYPTILGGKNRSQNRSIGGLPYKVISLGHGRRPLRQDNISALYQDSVFCLILPGDGCPQKRFFDVMLNGCIPLVLYFKESDEDGYPTFYQWSNSCSIRRTYPYAKGTFFEDAAAGIDYTSLVVTFDGLSGFDDLKPSIEAALQDKERLIRIRQTIRNYVTLFSYGLPTSSSSSSSLSDVKDKADTGELSSSFSYAPDAFMATLVSIRHYLFHLNDDKSKAKK